MNYSKLYGYVMQGRNCQQSCKVIAGVNVYFLMRQIYFYQSQSSFLLRLWIPQGNSKELRGKHDEMLVFESKEDLSHELLNLWSSITYPGCGKSVLL